MPHPRAPALGLFCALLLLVSSSPRASSHGQYSTLGDLLHWYTHTAQVHPTIMSYAELKEPGYEHGALPVATFTNFSMNARNKSKAILVFGEHAREIITCEVGLWLARVLVGDTAEIFGWPEWAAAFEPLGVAREAVGATVERWVGRILNNLVIKLLPVENVDGRQEWERGALCLRKTAKGVDLNRNYPFGFVQEAVRSEMYGGPHPLSEPQSRLIARLALEDVPAGGSVPRAYVNVHSGEWAVYSPWDSKAAVGPGIPADMSDVLRKSGDVCRCMAGPAGAVSNYLAFGTGMDFMYTQLGVPYALTYEVFGYSGILSNGATNKPLDSFPYTSDDRIARTVPTIEALLPPPDPGAAARQALREHSGHPGAVGHAAHAAHAHAAHAHTHAHARRSADEPAGGAASAAAARGLGWRRRVVGQRRAFERRGGAGAGAALDGAAGAGGASGLGHLRARGGRLLQAVRGMAGGRVGATGQEQEAEVVVAAGAVSDAGAGSAAAPGGTPLGGRSMRRLAAAAEDAGGLADATAAAAAVAEAEAADATEVREAVAAAGRQVLQEAGQEEGDTIMKMVRSQHRPLQSCFRMFNPEPGAAYRDAVSRWVVILLMTLDHVADPAHPLPSPHPLPGTVLAGAGAGGGAAAAAGRRRLLGAEQEGDGSGAEPGAARAAAEEEEGALPLLEASAGGPQAPTEEGEHGAAAAAAADAAAAGYGSEAFEARVRQRIYKVDPEMRRHSLVVLAALLCLGVVFVPWWMYVVERPAKQAPLMAAARRPRAATRV